MIRCRSCGAIHPPNTLFCDECGSRLSEARQVDTDPLPDEPPAAPAASSPITISLSTPDSVKRYERMLDGELLIGRLDPATGAHPDIDLSDMQGQLQGVSRRHARLIRRGQQVLLEDLHSLNGTFVRGMRLIAHNPQVIQPGDELQFGRVILKIDY